MENENVLEINNNYDFTQINLANPIVQSGGSYFTKFTIQNKNCYLELPKAYTKQVIVKNNTK